MKNSVLPQILLLYPKTGIDLGSTVAPPHALLSVAAPLIQAGYRVKLLDQRVEKVTRDVLCQYISKELICVGLSVMTGTQIAYAIGLAKMVRALTGDEIPLVWGGCHPSVLPEQTACHPLVDIVICGEGDETFLELVESLEAKRSLERVKGIVFEEENGIVKNDPRALLDVEKILPVPWELVDVESYIHRDMYLKESPRTLDIGQTSRGCPFQCGFCSSASIRQRRWRPMSVEKSLARIVDTVERFSLTGIWLRDDEFYIDRARATAIMEGMIQRKLNIVFYTSGTRADVFMKATDHEVEVLKRAGAYALKFGAESGSQRILDLMKKGITVEQVLQANRRCKKHGIIPAFSFMIGYPTETFEDVNKTIDLVFRLKRENPQAQIEAIVIYTPFPGTPDFQLALSHGLQPPEGLEGWTDWLFDDYDQTGRKTPWLNSKERQTLGSIVYMSVMSNALMNIFGTLRNIPLRMIAKVFAWVLSGIYRFRLKHKLYHWAPELRLVRALRRKIFYRTA